MVLVCETIDAAGGRLMKLTEDGRKLPDRAAVVSQRKTKNEKITAISPLPKVKAN